MSELWERVILSPLPPLATVWIGWQLNTVWHWQSGTGQRATLSFTNRNLWEMSADIKTVGSGKDVRQCDSHGKSN